MQLDLRSLALSRIFLGFLIIIDCFFRLQNFYAHYSDGGILPLQQLNLLIPQESFCLHCFSSNNLFIFSLFILQIIFALGMCLGWQTKVATICSWLLMVSLHNRNPLIIDGGDVLLRCVLFWSIFLPTGKVWSFERWRNKPKVPYMVKSWSFLTLPVQLFLLYFSSALLKTHPDWWPNGTAIGFALSLDAFVTPIGSWLLQFPNFLRMVTRAVFLMELLGAFLFFMPGMYRTVGIIIFIGFHLGLALAMDLALFPWIVIGCLIAIFPTEFWTFCKKTFRIEQQPEKIFNLSIGDKYLSWMALPILSIVIGWNIGNFTHRPIQKPFQRVAKYLRLDQYWGMFAPYPLKESGWFEFGVNLKNGSVKMIFLDRRMEDQWDTTTNLPIRPNRYFIDQRWRKYLLNLWEENNAKYRPLLGEYLCKRWNYYISAQEKKAVSLNMNLKLIQNIEYLVPSRVWKSKSLGIYPCKNLF